MIFLGSMLSAISYQLSAISHQQSAISFQRNYGIANRRTALIGIRSFCREHRASSIEHQFSVISCQRNYGIENDKDTFDWSTVILPRALSHELRASSDDFWGTVAKGLAPFHFTNLRLFSVWHLPVPYGTKYG